METVKTIQIKPITIVNSSSDAFVIESYTTFYSKHPQSFASLIFDEGEVPTAAEYLKGVEEAIANCKKSEGKTLFLDMPERYLSPEEQVKFVETLYEKCVKYTPLGYEYYHVDISPNLLINTQSPQIIERFRQYITQYCQTGGHDEGIEEINIAFVSTPE